MRTSRNTLIGSALLLAVVGGLVAAIIVPQSTDTGTPAREDLAHALHIVRGKIARHNMHHPEAPYDEETRPGPGFWDRLLKGRYLRGAPINVLQQSTLVVDSPRMGAGWVWRNGHMYGIDEHGRLYTGNGDDHPD